MGADYQKMQVVQLKALLKERDLPISGKKEELIGRLKKSDADKSNTSEVKEEAFFKALFGKRISLASLDRLQVTLVSTTVLMLIVIIISLGSTSWYRYDFTIEFAPGAELPGGIEWEFESQTISGNYEFGLSTLQVEYTPEGGETQSEEGEICDSSECDQEDFATAGKVAKVFLLLTLFGFLYIISIQIILGSGWENLFGGPWAIGFSAVMGAAMGGAIESVVGGWLFTALSAAFCTAVGVALGVLSVHYQKMISITTAICAGMLIISTILYAVIQPGSPESTSGFTIERGGLAGMWWVMFILSLAYAAIVLAQEEYKKFREDCRKSISGLLPTNGKSKS